MVGPITGETKQQVITQDVPGILGTPSIGPPSIGDKIVNNRDRRAEWKAKGMKEKLVDNTMSRSQIDNQLGDLFRQYRQPAAEIKPNVLHSNKQKRLYEQIDKAQEYRQSLIEPTPQEVGQADSVINQAVRALNLFNDRHNLSHPTSAKLKQFIDPSTNPLLKLRQDNAKPNASDLVNQIKELIMNTKNKENRADLERILEGGDMDAIREAIER